MRMKTAKQIAADVAVLLAELSYSGTGAPPCGGLVSGRGTIGDVTLWGGVTSETKERDR